MKKTKLLKKITDIFYYVYGISITIVVPIVFIVIFIKIYTVGFIYEEKKYTSIFFLTIFWGIIKYGISLGLLYCLFLFRKIVHLFLELHIFHPDVIYLLKKTGKHLITIGLIMFLTSIYSPEGFTYTTTSEIGFSITETLNHNFDFLNFMWVIVIATGLFFQVLSEIFKKAQSLEQENDLTI